MKCKSAAALIFIAISSFAASAAAQTCPGFPARGVQIIDALYNPALAQGSDDQRRALTRTFIEQLVYESPSDGWTWKSADPGRPPSKDSIARLVSGRLCNWDWQNGSTRARSVQVGQPGEDITGQNPIPVPGVNHLSETPSPGPVPVPSPGPAPVPTDLSPILMQNERIFANLTAQLQALAAQQAATDARLQRHDESPGWFVRVVSNRYVQLAMGAAGAWFTNEVVR